MVDLSLARETTPRRGSRMRAIVAAHAQSTANRAMRELGRSGVWVLVVFLVVIGATFLAPIWAAMLGLGFVLGKSLEAEPTPTIMALLGGLLFDQSRQAQDRAFQQGVAGPPDDGPVEGHDRPRCATRR